MDSLSINRKSSKISKPNKKPPHLNNRPPAQVYNTIPSEFRKLVQQLTGTQPPCTISQPSRLHKIAPPPLAPASLPTFQQTPYRNLSFSPSSFFSPLPALTPGDSVWANTAELQPFPSPHKVNVDVGDPGGSLNTTIDRSTVSPTFLFPFSPSCLPPLSPGFFSPRSPAFGFVNIHIDSYE